jgi:Mn-dependent DtxR family transcriptional regulator
MIRDILNVATPSMRPLWVGRTKPLTADEVEVLRLALRDDPHLRWTTVHARLGERRATAALRKLKDAGGIHHVTYNHYRITEKGRIGLALVSAKGETSCRPTT